MKRAEDPAPLPAGGQTWNTADYAKHSRFVADLAGDLVALLNPRPGERILDIGCGDGALTERLAATGAILTGVDASPEMILAARARRLDVHLISATELPFHEEFDAVFSNAALHWIPENDQPAALGRIARALRPGGRFVAEMGGKGNIAAIRSALSAALTPLGIDPEATAASFYPSPEHYGSLLQQSGFTLQSMELIPRPTPLSGGSDGMKIWLNIFRNGVLDLLPRDLRAVAVAETVEILRPTLLRSDQVWVADYVRLRFSAVRP